MYDFLFQEEWWMETIIAAIITGVLSFAAAYLAYATKVEKYLEKIVDSNLRMEGQNSSILDKGESQTKSLSRQHKDLSDEHSNLSNEHKDLSNEHKDLSNEHKDLSNEHKDLSNEHKDLSNEHRDLSKEHSDLKSEIQKVIANQEKEKAVREAYGKVIPEGDTFKHMADAIYMHSVQLQQEVNTLKNQIVQLENKNRDQKQQIIALKKRLSKEQEKPIERNPAETEKNEYDEILDNMDLSPDSHDEEEWER